jgi:aspartyl-tRNA synthetase
LHPYRTHTCGQARKELIGSEIRLSGWVHRKRDHGHLLFIDLRDHYGVTQVVIQPESAFFDVATHLKPESVITVTGKVVARTAETANAKLPTGDIELVAEAFEIQSTSETLPFLVADPNPVDESIRLQYRFLDLRRDELHANIILRSRIISSIRRRMTELEFNEFQTPILTASSPEGARDFIVPSRLHPGKFYALPQAPQMFKQLLMVSGFDRYFQIAACFRDEDARADRSPGEFYQLDIEMSYATQDDVFAVLEGLLVPLFEEFAETPKPKFSKLKSGQGISTDPEAAREMAKSMNGPSVLVRDGYDESRWEVTQGPFPRIPYLEALLKYGTDKPDLRFGLEFQDATKFIGAMSLPPFQEAIKEGGIGRIVAVPNAADKSRKFFQDLEDFMKRQGAPGLGYVSYKDGEAKGPLLKFMSPEQQAELKAMPGVDLKNGVVFFVVGAKGDVQPWQHALRVRLANDLELIKPGVFKFCWIVDFPMFEKDPDSGKVGFSHNPFSMPQGGMEALLHKDPLEILAYQYDIVCNGIELSSGAVRNHRPEIMYKAFEIAGYGPEVVEAKFGGMLRAFKFGAPPHAGIAPGVDRIVMLLANQPSIREVITFPMNAQACDLLMNAPNEVTAQQLEDVHIAVKLPKGFEKK